MTIQWPLYNKLYRLNVTEAALLWLEIEPTPELIESPPHGAQVVQELINNKLYDRAKALLIDTEKDDPVGQCVIDSRVTPNWTEYFKGRMTKEQYHFKVFQAETKPVTQAERFNALASIPLTFETATLKDLREIALELGEKPKFLFHEENEEKPLNTKKRNSYLKLIKGLLKKQGIDPNERGIAKSLVGMVKDAKQSLEDDAIRDILKEVQDLEADD